MNRVCVRQGTVGGRGTRIPLNRVYIGWALKARYRRAFAQLEPLVVPASGVIVRRESRDLERFLQEEHQSGNEDSSLHSG